MGEPLLLFQLDGGHLHEKLRRRIERYADGINPERIREVLERKRESMIANALLAFEELDRLTVLVKQLLDSKGVSCMQRVFYHAFAGELSKLKRRLIFGSVLDKEATIVQTKWEMRGLDPKVLSDIRTEIVQILKPEEATESAKTAEKTP
jgi:hypothetical protein